MFRRFTLVTPLQTYTVISSSRCQQTVMSRQLFSSRFTTFRVMVKSCQYSCVLEVVGLLR